MENNKFEEAIEKVSKSSEEVKQAPKTVKAAEPKITGEVFFQFDNDEAVKLQDLLEGQHLSIALKQPTKNNDGITYNPGNESVIQFKKGDKIFKIFIKSKD